MWYLIGVNDDASKQILYSDRNRDYVFAFSRGYNFSETQFKRVVIVSDVEHADDSTLIYWRNDYSWRTDFSALPEDMMSITEDVLRYMHEGKIIQAYELLSAFYTSVSKKLRDGETSE